MLSNERPAKASPEVAKAVQTDRMNHVGLRIAGTGKAKRNAVGCTLSVQDDAPQKVYKGAENNRQRLYLVFVILYKRGECAIGKAKSSELNTSSGTMILVRFQSLLLLSNSFFILVSEYYSKSSCVCCS